MYVCIQYTCKHVIVSPCVLSFLFCCYPHFRARYSRPGTRITETGEEVEQWKEDCLHMCMPGPLDLVPRLLHHELLLLEFLNPKHPKP